MRILIGLLLLLFCAELHAQQPDGVKSDSTSTINGKKYYIHQVEAKRTLFSLSRLYQVPVADIKSINQLTEDALKVGQYLKIPFTKTTTIPTATPKATAAQSPTSTTAAAPATPTTVARFNISPHSNTLNVVLFVPLYLNLLPELTFPTEGEVKSPQNYKSFTFIGFLQGALLAIDSLQKQGISVSLTILDEMEDTNAFKKYFKKPEMEQIDAFIGPMYTTTSIIAARYVKQRNLANNPLYLFSPLLYHNDILTNNPGVIKMAPNATLQLTALAKHLIADTIKSNIVLVYRKNTNELAYANTIKSQLTQVPDSLKKFSFKEVIWNSSEENNWVMLRKNLQPNKPNKLIYLFNGEALVSSVVRNLYNSYGADSIFLYGLPSWLNYTNLEINQLLKLRTHFFTDLYIDYQRADVTSFIKTFHQRYSSIPDKYAYKGFDITYLAITAMQKKEKLELPQSNQAPYKGLQNEFLFQSTLGNGFENTLIPIFKYDNYQMQRAN